MSNATLAFAWRRLRRGWRAGDLLITGIATHKLSRLLTKDKVTATIRAPFTEYEEATGFGEVSEKPRGSGVRRSLGELLLQGKNNLQAPWLGLTGFAVIAVTLSLLIFAGEAVRDAFDPRKTFA